MKRKLKELTGDEKDSLAANCPLCWSRPGSLCSVMYGTVVTARKRRHPHPERIDRAGRRGVLGGIGRLLLERGRAIDG